MDEPWPDDILAVTCMRVDRMDTVVPGSLVKTCWRCECSIWVSPSTLEHVRTQLHRLLCMECMMHYAALEKDPQNVTITEAQLEELRQAFAAKGLPPPTQEQLDDLKKKLVSGGLLPPKPKLPFKR